ncbi:PREDICTED: uncharacterized protein LOC106805077 [Priapulus caudatus]|uniref:Uncharacterized protein LOC106805077 n=1 Tax=Priapulus caudatus TaxID=37621 RepID=A0ABM1DQ21_PRICU|nr:PREDICTED: uncharacterized protein LOC106805077 [Priapulus caudatus]
MEETSGRATIARERTDTETTDEDAEIVIADFARSMTASTPIASPAPSKASVVRRPLVRRQLSSIEWLSRTGVQAATSLHVSHAQVQRYCACGAQGCVPICFLQKPCLLDVLPPPLHLCIIIL